MNRRLLVAWLRVHSAELDCKLQVGQVRAERIGPDDLKTLKSLNFQVSPLCCMIDSDLQQLTLAARRLVTFWTLPYSRGPVSRQSLCTYSNEDSKYVVLATWHTNLGHGVFDMSF